MYVDFDFRLSIWCDIKKKQQTESMEHHQLKTNVFNEEWESKKVKLNMQNQKDIDKTASRIGSIGKKEKYSEKYRIFDRFDICDLWSRKN